MIHAGAVETVLQNSLGPYTYLEPDHAVFISDTNYTPLSGFEALGMLADAPDLEPSRYVPQVYDCEDFAVTARSLAAVRSRDEGLGAPYCLGVVQTRRHTVNFTVDRESRVWLVDFYYRRCCFDAYEGFLLEKLGFRWLKPRSLELIYI